MLREPSPGGGRSVRILIVNKYARVTGGADTHCLRLAACLRERGHEVAWLSTADAANEEHAGAFLPVSVTHSTRSAMSWADQARVASRALWNRAAAGAMARLVRDFRPDVVSAHKLYPQLSVAPVVVAARARVPVVQTLHDYELVSASASDHSGSAIDRDEERWTFRLLNAATFAVRRAVHARQLSACVSVSRFVASVHDRHGIRSTVLENPAGRPSPDEETASFERRRGVVFAGHLSQAKGFPDLLEAARALPEIPFTVAGTGPLEQLARGAADVAANVDYLGWVGQDRLRSALASARLVALPSRWEEPSGLVALEALAVGTPVIAYRKGGLPEIVTGTGAGRTVEPSVEALVLACRELHEDAIAWERLSRRGLAAARTAWAIEAWGEQMSTLLASAAR